MQELPGFTLAVRCLKRKMKSYWLLLPRFGGIFGILRSLDIRSDMRHGEALVFFTGAGGTFPEILFTFIQRKFLSTINAHIFSRADFLSRGVRLLFSQLIHQNFHARQRYISVAFVHHKRKKRRKIKKFHQAKVYCVFFLRC